jgi:hypothetical protein
MRRRPAYEFDNRDSEQVYGYMEARIDALKQRIKQLEAEKEALQCAALIVEETRTGELRNLTKYMAVGRTQYQQKAE